MDDDDEEGGATTGPLIGPHWGCAEEHGAHHLEHHKDNQYIDFTEFKQVVVSWSG